MAADQPQPAGLIGVFDSGVGGLSVLEAIRQQLPKARLVYLADQAHVPYGSRPLNEVRSFAAGITRFLLAQGCSLVVVACNTASAAALHSLRQAFPTVPFVGMEPAVKPAAEQTHSRVVGVLATPATFQGELYASVVERFAQGVTVLQHTCPGLVPLIEAGRLEALETRRILEDVLRPMLEQGVDTVVLGCTHYPFVIPLIQEIAGPGVRVIDPAPAIARRVQRLSEHTLEGGKAEVPASRPLEPSVERASLRLFTSGDPAALNRLLPCLLGEDLPVEQVRWTSGGEDLQTVESG